MPVSKSPSATAIVKILPLGEPEGEPGIAVISHGIAEGLIVILLARVRRCFVPAAFEQYKRIYQKISNL